MTLLQGAKAIARYLSAGCDPVSGRQVRHLIARDLIPTFKLGSIHCTTPEMLSRHFGILANGGTHGN